MVRLLALLLVLANGAYFAWSQGRLRAYGLGPVQQSEPQRMVQQIRPQALRILKADDTPRAQTAAVAPAPTAASKPAECLQAGLYDDKQSAVLREAAGRVLPAASWSLKGTVVPAHWIVYMGKYPDAEAVNKKKAELRLRKVSFEGLANLSLEPGLSLGGFETQAAATQALGKLTQRGIRTAHVVQERAELRGQLFKLPAVDDNLRSRLDNVKSALAGKPLQACH